MTPAIAAIALWPIPSSDRVAAAARSAPSDRAGFAVLERGADGPHRLVFQGRLVLARAADLWKCLRREAAELHRGDRVHLDMSAVDAIDGGTIALLVELRAGLVRRGVDAAFVGGPAHVRELIRLYEGGLDTAPRRRRRPEGFLAQVGRSTIEVARELVGVLGFLGAVVRAVLGLLKEPRTGNWKDVLPTMERTGADAIPIVVLINFLVGFVVAYQAATQLEQFGADLYVADLVGKAMTREMGPLMTAIILTGRSGAAFAAELGSMKVAEEIDALRVMGFGPVRYLVLPRMLGLALVAPVLTLIADFVGLFGGYVVAVYQLDLSPLAYLHRLQEAIVLWDVVSGLDKSIAFAVAIALISCQQGFATTGGAEGVGRRTTAAVVASLFALILIDTGFTVFFAAYDL